MTPDFADKLQAYIENLTVARANASSERQISHLFLGFVSDAFGVEYQDIELEHHVVMTKVQKHGYIDALLGDLIIEFKRNIHTDLGRNIDQLVEYMREMPELHRFVGMLTDGMDFRSYILDEDEAAIEVARFNIGGATPEEAWLWLDSYLFSDTQIQPTAADIVQRFGINSPTFQLVRQTFYRLLGAVEGDSELEVWRGQWKALLSKVYGSDIADDDLFIRHSYLSQFAKLLAFAAMQGRPKSEEIASIVNGKAFNSYGVSNIGENDFFSWLMMQDIRSDAVNALYALSAELQVYDLSAVRQDLLKQLYQDLVAPVMRHDLGEYYTPDWLAQLILREVGYDAPQSLLDPACGSGTFLFNAIIRLAEGGLRGQDLVDFAMNNIVGIDVHPLAVTIARVNYLLALSEHLGTQNGEDEAPPVPVFLADALIRPLENRSPDSVTIPVDWGNDEVFHIPVESASDADKLTRTIDYMDDIAKIVSSPEQAELMGEVFQTLGSRHLWRAHQPDISQLVGEQFPAAGGANPRGAQQHLAYILKNLSRPLVLAENQFDIVAGNPPWLSYRYINSAVWQDEVKDLCI